MLGMRCKLQHKDEKYNSKRETPNSTVYHPSATLLSSARLVH